VTAERAKPRPNYPRWPEEKPSWRVLVGPILFYFGMINSDGEFAIEKVVWPVLCFGVALVVGQSLVEWLDRTEWRRSLKDKAEKAREDALTAKEKKEKAAKEKAEKDKDKDKSCCASQTGSTKKKKS